MRKLVLLALCMCLTVSQLWAQAARTITGKVTDDKGVAVVGASILVKGTTVGTLSKADGTFSLSVPASAKAIVISSQGFATQEITLGNNGTFNVKMATEDKSLDEVVVVAYGTVKKTDFTGSANTISNKEFANRPIINPLNAVVANAPGVQSTAAGGAPGSSPDFRIRGFGSLAGGNAPLIVVDNVPYDGGIANLNTEDIETITILKDAATVSLWGARGSNGVIMITTKRGKMNRNTVGFKVTQGVSSRGLDEYDRVDAFQYYPLMWEAYRNTLRYTNGQALATANTNATNGIKAQLGYNPFNVANNDIVRTDGTLNPNAQLLYGDDLDWAKQLIRVGNRQEYSVNFTGGNEKSDYYGSVGYVNEKGFLIRSDWRRWTGRLNLNVQPLKWFKAGANLSTAYNNSNQASDGSSTGYVNPFFFTRQMGPIYPVYAHNVTTGAYLLDAQGNKIYDNGGLTSLGLPARINSPGRHVVQETMLNQSAFRRSTLSARGYGSLIITPNLKFTANLSTDISDASSRTYENNIIGDGAPAGRASKSATKTISYTFNQTLDYDKTFKNHHISALAGHENYSLTIDAVSGSKQGQIFEGQYEFGNFSVINSANSSIDKRTIESYFGRVNYDYKGKYYASFNIRRDGNSRFSPENRWANFYGISGGWRIDKEKFMSNVSWINNLKLRTSYGELGNEDITAFYAYQSFYSLGYNNSAEPGSIFSQYANRDLTWETSKPFDLGVDFTLLKNRIRGTIEYYYRVTDGLIFNVNLPLSTGSIAGTGIPVNIGSMYNKGFEIEVAGDIVRKRDFNWEVKINATTLKNKLTRMPDQYRNPLTGEKEQINGTKRLTEGRSIYDFYLRQWYGVDPSDGAALYIAQNTTGSGVRVLDKNGVKDTVTTDINNAKLAYSGTAIPDVYGGITNTFTYKNFELSFLLQYQIGGLVYDGVYQSLMHAGTYGTALHADALNRWTTPGQITDVPRMQQSTVGIADAQSSRWLTKASFLNIRSINFSYKFPKSIIGKIKAQNASFYIGAENVYLFSKRKGMFVNQSFNGTASTNVYTPARILTTGINVNF